MNDTVWHWAVTALVNRVTEFTFSWDIYLLNMLVSIRTATTMWKLLVCSLLMMIIELCKASQYGNMKCEKHTVQTWTVTEKISVCSPQTVDLRRTMIFTGSCLSPAGDVNATGYLVYWLPLWTLNPVIWVQISGEPAADLIDFQPWERTFLLESSIFSSEAKSKWLFHSFSVVDKCIHVFKRCPPPNDDPIRSLTILLLKLCLFFTRSKIKSISLVFWLAKCAYRVKSHGQSSVCLCDNKHLASSDD